MTDRTPLHDVVSPVWSQRTPSVVAAEELIEALRVLTDEIRQLRDLMTYDLWSRQHRSGAPTTPSGGAG